KVTVAVNDLPRTSRQQRAGRAVFTLQSPDRDACDFKKLRTRCQSAVDAQSDRPRAQQPDTEGPAVPRLLVGACPPLTDERRLIGIQRRYFEFKPMTFGKSQCLALHDSAAHASSFRPSESAIPPSRNMSARRITIEDAVNIFNEAATFSLQLVPKEDGGQIGATASQQGNRAIVMPS